MNDKELVEAARRTAEATVPSDIATHIRWELVVSLAARLVTDIRERQGKG